MSQTSESPALTPYLRGLQWGFLVLGVGILLFQYGFNRSLWLDEASLALNIQERDMLGLLQPLDYDQAAPLGFLVVVKTITNLLGISEYSLRLFPLLAGLATIGLFIWVCRLVAPSALPLGIGLLATSAIHIDYATEFKQYIVDAPLALWYIGLGVVISRAPTRHHIALAGIIGAIAVWFSHPIIFVLAGVGVVLWLDAIGKKHWQVVRWLSVMGMVQVVSFGVVYMVAYRNVIAGTEMATFMNDFWKDRFLEISPYSILRFIFEVFIHLGGIGQNLLLVLVIYGVVMGIIRLPKQITAFILLPMVWMCGASLLQLYPLSDRLLLYSFAPLLLIVAVGWQTIITHIAQKSPRPAVLVLAILMVLLLIRIPAPLYKDDVRGAFAWLEATRPPDDPVYAIILTGRTGKFYGYHTSHFPAPLPKDKRIWIVIDRPLSMVNVTVPHIAYRFVGRFDIFVMCLPVPDMPCPP